MPAEAGVGGQRAAGGVGGAGRGDLVGHDVAAGRVDAGGGGRQRERGEGERGLHSFTSSVNSTVRGGPAVNAREMVRVGSAWLWKSEA